MTLGQARAVTDNVFRKAITRIEEAGDGHESAGASDDFARDHFGVTRTKGMEHATGGDAMADDGREGREGSGVFLAGLGEQFGGAGVVRISEGRHALVYARKPAGRKAENRDLKREKTSLWQIGHVLKRAIYPRILALGLAALCVSARAADLIPIEDFARLPKYYDIKLSPDGEYVGFIRDHEGVKRLCFADVATMKLAALNLPVTSLYPVERHVFDFEWLGAKRVLFMTSSGWAAADRDRKNFKDFGWQNSNGGGRVGTPDVFHGKVVHLFDDDRAVLATNHRLDLGVTETQYTEVTKLDTVTGLGTTVAKNPGKMVRWIADAKGCVRAGVSITEGIESLLYRATEQDEWRIIVSSPKLEFDLQGFTEDGTGLYVFARPATGAGGLYRFDPEKRELGEALWKNPVYEPSALVLDPTTQKLVGVRYVAEYPKTQWLDERYTAFQAAVDKVLAGRVNELSGFSRDLSCVLVKSFSDREPTSAYIFNTVNGEIREIGKSRSWIKSGQMAAMRPISYVSRDGIRIFGYLTIPNGTKPENLPMVVLPHESLRSRDVFGFAPLVQMLANRGYAVLQMNHRGSAGYGWEFRRKAVGETGGNVQADIDDATHWAITKKIADPKRIAIVGFQYGGYSALYALAKSDGLYCCGIAVTPITDWPAYLKDMKLDTGFRFRLQSIEPPVDESLGETRLKAISPVNFAAEIKAPILIIKKEGFSPESVRQAQGMISSLKKANHPSEQLAISGNMSEENAHIAEYKAVEAFLAKHLGPGATGTAPIATVSAGTAPEPMAKR